MKILVSGATGFIGRRLVAHLLADSRHSVTAVLRRAPDVQLVCDAHVVDLRDSSGFAELMTRIEPDAIVHLAAAGVHPGDRDVERLTEVNANWPATLVRAAAKARKCAVIVAGTSAEYAPTVDRIPITETAPLESRALYGATKAAGGLLALATGAALDVPVAVLRLFNIYGAGEAEHRLLPSIFFAAREGRTVGLSAGTQVRDFIEVDDACLAIAGCLAPLNEGAMALGHYNVASGRGATVADFAKTVVAELGANPALLEFDRLPMRPDDLPWLVGSPDRLTAATGWRAKTLAQGVRHAIAGMT